MINIGFDLDNTIVNCFKNFKAVSFRMLKDDRINKFKSREALRSYIRELYNDNTWTEIQANVYGPEYMNSKPFKNTLRVLRNLYKNKDINIYIVSHKTKMDSAKKGYNLQKYAYRWIQKNIINKDIKIDRKNIFLCETMDEKINVIKNLKLECFVDDLEEIYIPLIEKISFPILFTSVLYTKDKKYNLAKSWTEIGYMINEFCRTK